MKRPKATKTATISTSGIAPWNLLLGTSPAIVSGGGCGEVRKERRLGGNKHMKGYQFGGVFDDVEVSKKFFCKSNTRPGTVYIKKVIYSYPATIVFWSDDTKTIAKCSEADEYSEEAGLSLCILKKFVGTDVLRKTFEDWLPSQYYESYNYGEAVVETKDLRNKYKAIEV